MHEVLGVQEVGSGAREENKHLLSTGTCEDPSLNSCGTIKIPPSSKALSAEHRPKFLQPFTGNGDVSI
jgi:hypothetical protein